MDSLPDKVRKCHRCNFEKSCRDLVLSEECQRWSKISGSNPQTGEPMDKWACVDDLGHILLLEIGNQTSKVSVEINALRNEVAKGNAENVSMGAMAVQRAREAVQEAVHLQTYGHISSHTFPGLLLPKRDDHNGS